MSERCCRCLQHLSPFLSLLLLLLLFTCYHSTSAFRFLIFIYSCSFTRLILLTSPHPAEMPLISLTLKRERGSARVRKRQRKSHQQQEPAFLLSFMKSAAETRAPLLLLCCMGQRHLPLMLAITWNYSQWMQLQQQTRQLHATSHTASTLLFPVTSANQSHEQCCQLKQRGYALCDQ